MLDALKAVEEGTTSINRAATEYGVPKTTLRTRWQEGSCMAQIQDLNLTCLQRKNNNWLRIGYGKTQAQILEIVEEVTTKKGINVKKHITDGWFRRKNRKKGGRSESQKSSGES